jgi:integrase/recombinase XerD
MSDEKQSALFDAGELPGDIEPFPINSRSSLQAALGLFQQYMQEEGFSVNTQKAFASDIRLLAKYLGIGQPVGEIGTKNLNDFLHWMVEERGVPCSPKTYARRVTTLKVFFSWLHENGVLPLDPSSAVIQRTVRSPLPTLPSEEELARALFTAGAWRRGEGDAKGKPDARPHLLLTLLLQTGIKKGEAMSMVPNHIDRSDAGNPVLHIRYRNPRLRYKERKLALEPEWLDVLDEYLVQYEPADTLFTCTARNLEYILRDIGEAAGLTPGMLSFENLRWCSALRSYRQKEDEDKIRQRLGLSKITWRETRNKLSRLQEREEGVATTEPKRD